MIFMGNAEVMRRNDERRICELKFSWDWQLRLQDACPVPLNSNYRYSILNTLSPSNALKKKVRKKNGLQKKISNPKLKK